MDVAVVTWFYEDQPGYLDFSYRIRALAAEHTVTLISRAPITQEELLVDDCERIVLRTPSTTRKSMLLYQAQAARLLRTRQPDVIVLLGSQLSFMGLMLRNFRVLVYWNEHPLHFTATRSKNPMKKLLSRLLCSLSYAGARSARIVMPISEAMEEDLLEHGISRQRVQLAYMGVASWFVSAGEADQLGAAEQLVLVYAGTIAKERGRDIMLEGLAAARRRNVPARLILVGATEDQLRYCNVRARELGIAEHVEVEARIAGRDIPRYLRRAHAGICIWEDKPYWHFNPPTKLFEYLVAGLPVLASNIRSHTRYVRDGVTGFVFDYDSNSFADAVCRLWERRLEIGTFRRCAREESGQYIWESIRPSFLTAIELSGSR